MWRNAIRVVVVVIWHAEPNTLCMIRTLKYSIRQTKRYRKCKLYSNHHSVLFRCETNIKLIAVVGSEVRYPSWLSRKTITYILVSLFRADNRLKDLRVDNRRAECQRQITRLRVIRIPNPPSGAHCLARHVNCSYAITNVPDNWRIKREYQGYRCVPALFNRPYAHGGGESVVSLMFRRAYFRDGYINEKSTCVIVSFPWCRI